MTDNRRNWYIAIFGVCIFYCALRIGRMTDSCLWFDEIFSVHAAEHDWGPMLWFAAQDLIHPPLFYAVLKIWIAIGGEGLVWLRLLPAGLACLALIPIYLLSRELKLGDRVIAAAIFLLAINGALIKYSQLVRMYSLLMFVSLLSLWLFARYFNRGKNLAALIAVNLLMVYTHYFGWVVIGCEIAAILAFQRFKWRGIAVMTGIVSVLFLPWIWYVSKASAAGSALGQNISWISRPEFAHVGTYFVDLAEPFYFQASSDEPASNYFISIPLLLLFALAATMFLYRHRKNRGRGNGTFYFLAIFSLLPVVIVFFASWVLPYSIWGTRHLIIAAGPMMLLASMILDEFDQGKLRLTAAVLIVILSGIAFLLYTSKSPQVYVWCAWDRVAERIVSETPENERAKIYTFEDLAAYHVWFATRNSRRTEIAAVKNLEGMYDDPAYFLPRGFQDVAISKIEDIKDENAWLVFRNEVSAQEGLLFGRFKEAGYAICPNAPVRFGKTDVFKVQIVRGEANCGK